MIFGLAVSQFLSLYLSSHPSLSPLIPLFPLVPLSGKLSLRFRSCFKILLLRTSSSQSNVRSRFLSRGCASVNDMCKLRIHVFENREWTRTELRIRSAKTTRRCISAACPSRISKAHLFSLFSLPSLSSLSCPPFSLFSLFSLSSLSSLSSLPCLSSRCLRCFCPDLVQQLF